MTDIIPVDYLLDLNESELSSKGSSQKPDTSDRTTVCQGYPVVITKLTTDPGATLDGIVPHPIAQNNCPKWRESGEYCACIQHEDMIYGPIWTFRVKGRNENEEPPIEFTKSKLSYNEENALSVTSLGRFVVASQVTNFNLYGVGSSPVSLKLNLRSQYGQADGEQIVAIDSSKYSLDTVNIANIDLSAHKIKGGFLPNVVSNITMTRSNIQAIDENFMNDNVKYLDLSYNRLTDFYSGTAEDYPLETLDLSHNSFAFLPPSISKFHFLKNLNLKGNRINDYTISSELFNRLGNLTTFDMDPQNGRDLNCTKPNTRSLLNVGSIESATKKYWVFCVTGMDDAESAADRASQAGNLKMAVIGTVFLVVVLAYIAVRNYRWQRKYDSKTSTNNSGFNDLVGEHRESREYSMFPVDRTIVNDPLIATNRIPYKEVIISEVVNKGGFGIVYLGTYRGRRVAVKKIRSDRNGEIDQIEIFLKEICLIATLKHPRIVEFIGVAWDSLRNLSAVTEFMDRGDLRDVLQTFKGQPNGARLTWANYKTSIALHIAEALTYLHGLTPKVIHRDLKSKNILLTSEMEAKLSDFGISRERDIDATHMTAGIGTSFWIAPEVLLGMDYDERADIYSFGIVLSEIDTNDYPYWNAANQVHGGRVQENAILRMVVSGEVRPAFSDTCPPDILKLADKCLEGNPSDRPSGAQIVSFLEHLLINNSR